MHDRIRQLQHESDLDTLLSEVNIDTLTLQRKMPEWGTLVRLVRELQSQGSVHHLGWAEDRDLRRLPLLALSFGSKDPKAPVLGLVGGVHGLERIGSQVVLAFLHSLSELILWDRLLQEALQRIRIFFVPMINPMGIFHRTRANPRGVDLMRNAPIESLENPTSLVAGHRISPLIPWYRGPEGTAMEPESQALIEFCRSQFFASPRVITLDFHSGFGAQDRIWFPYAHSPEPFPHLPEVHALKEAFERIHPHHFYKIEPQAKNYTTHGDLWDYAYDLYYQEQDPRSSVYLPLAVEMGSWMWVKKNPLQMFSILGPYNPMKAHRVRRILRRHNTLFDFMIRSLVSNEVWTPSNEEQREKHRQRALETWYR